MQDGIEMLLQVDAFAQAVGADQHLLGRFGQLVDAFLTFGGRKQCR